MNFKKLITAIIFALSPIDRDGLVRQWERGDIRAENAAKECNMSIAIS